MTVSYTNSQKDKLEIQYKPGLPVVEESPVPDHWVKQGHTGMTESVPAVSINGKPEIPYGEWPVIGSPFINLTNNKLDIRDGKKRIVVDWQGDYPKIKRTNDYSYQE